MDADKLHALAVDVAVAVEEAGGQLAHIEFLSVKDALARHFGMPATYCADHEAELRAKFKR